MSPSSPRVRFWRRALGVAAGLWLLFLIISLVQTTSVVYEEGVGLAAVSAGISEFIVESTLLLLVGVAIAWVWGRLTDRRS